MEHDKTTLKDYCENIYLTKYIKESNLSPTTIKGYRQILETEGGIYELMGDHSATAEDKFLLITAPIPLV